MTAVDLDRIRMDGGTQPRSITDTDLVAQYSEAMLEGAAFPPVTVFFDGTDYWLADGFHRVHGAIGCGLADIECDVRQGTVRDAILFSVGANASHGLRRTNEDKRRAVMRLLNDAEWCSWSNREIARVCAVAEVTVRRFRPEVTAPMTQSPQERTYTTRHGTVTTMNTARIGRTEPDRPVFDNTPFGQERSPPSPQPSPPEPQPVFADDGDRNVSWSLWEIDKLMQALGEPQAAVAQFPSRHHHTMSSAKLRQISAWFARAADAWAHQIEGAHRVAAE